MTIRTCILAALLLCSLMPLAPGASACRPVEDKTATPVGVGSTVYYEKVTQFGSLTIVEHWQETNGVAGLQTNPNWSCVGKADKLLQRFCVGCPIPM